MTLGALLEGRLVAMSFTPIFLGVDLGMPPSSHYPLLLMEKERDSFTDYLFNSKSGHNLHIVAIITPPEPPE